VPTATTRRLRGLRRGHQTLVLRPCYLLCQLEAFVTGTRVGVRARYGVLLGALAVRGQRKAVPVSAEAQRRRWRTYRAGRSPDSAIDQGGPDAVRCKPKAEGSEWP
jgi:hypothetical protein